jgi:HK97 family phage major capsid protein
MSIDAFLVYLRDNLALKMGDALATAIFSGKGKAGEEDVWKSEPLGIVTALEAESLTPQVITWTPTSDPINYAKLTAMMAKMKSGYASGAAIFAKNDFIWNYLANVLDESKRPYFIANPINGGVGMMFGKVVYEEDAAPADGMVLANVARGYKINAQENVTMYTEDQIKSRITDYMAYAIIDGKPISTAPFVYLKKSA